MPEIESFFKHCNETKTKYRITQDMMQQDREFISSMLQPKTDTAYTNLK